MGTKLPIRSVCRNCGAELVGRYCHVCGQDVFAGTGGRLRDVLANSLDVVFAFDGKVWRSLAALVARPGKLTREWLDGRIARYVHPSKLFWFLSIVFFALLVGATDSRKSRQQIEKPQTEQVEQANPEQKTEQNPEQVSGLVRTNDAGEVSMMPRFLSWAPYLMLVMAPVFAGLVRLFYRRRELFYADYLVFALHFQAFVFLFYSLPVAVRFAFPGLPGEGVGRHLWFSVGVLVPWIYLIISLRRVFGAKFAYSVLKTIAITVLYLLAMFAVVVGVTFAWMAVMGKQG